MAMIGVKKTMYGTNIKKESNDPISVDRKPLEDMWWMDKKTNQHVNMRLITNGKKMLWEALGNLWLLLCQKYKYTQSEKHEEAIYVKYNRTNIVTIVVDWQETIRKF